MRKILPACLLTLALPCAHAGLDDPFGTADGLALRPAGRLASRVAEAPCATQLPAQALNAAEAVDLALCNNPQTRDVWAAARVQAAQLGVAQAAWLPSLAASAGQTRYNYDTNPYTKRSATLNVSWLLYDFGQRGASVDSARALFDAALATQDATVQAVFLAALQAYYTALATEALVVSTNQAERSAREAFAAAEARYQVGVATPADKLQAQTAYSQATLTRIRAEGDARNARGALANALGFPASASLTLAAAAVPPASAGFRQDVEALIAEAVARRPDLKAAEAQLRAADAGIALARAQGRPTLALAGGPLWQDTAGTQLHGNTVGLTLNVPIFSGFDTTYRVRAAEALSEQRAAQRDRLRNQVSLDVWKAYQSLMTAEQSLRTAGDLVASAEQSERVALGRYKAGVGTILDLLAAQSALAGARQQRIQAELDWNVYRATLAQAMGTLDHSLLDAPAEGRP